MMHRFKFFNFLIACFIFNLSFFASRAFAEEVGYDVSNYSKYHPNYLGNGIRAGSFLIHPEIDVEERYDDNIYATPSNKTNDYITGIKPIIVAESDWNNHALKLSAAGDLGYYSENTSENYRDYALKSSGKLDVLRGNYFFGDLDYYKDHEERGSPEDAGGVKPNVYNETVTRVGFTHEVSRLSTTVGTEFRKLSYNDNHTNSGVIIDQSGRDRSQYGVDIRLDYELIPGYKAFLKSAGNRILYDDKVASNNRNSSGITVDAGTAIELTGKLRGEVYVGYLQQQYDNSIYSTVSGIDAGGKLSWNVTTLTLLETGLLRSVNETIIPGSSGYIETTFFIAATHELMRNLKLDTKLDYRNDSYKGVSRNDDVYTFTFGSKYLFSDHVALRSAYTFRKRNSDVALGNYDENIFTVGVSLAL